MKLLNNQQKMRHGIAVFITILLAFLILVPLVWWMIRGYSISQTFDMFGPKSASTTVRGSGSYIEIKSPTPAGTNQKGY